MSSQARPHRLTSICAFAENYLFTTGRAIHGAHGLTRTGTPTNGHFRTSRIAILYVASAASEDVQCHAKLSHEEKIPHQRPLPFARLLQLHKSEQHFCQTLVLKLSRVPIPGTGGGDAAFCRSFALPREDLEGRSTDFIRAKAQTRPQEKGWHICEGKSWNDSSALIRAGDADGSLS